MLNVKKTITFASAASVLSLSTAYAQDYNAFEDDLFASEGLLELSETAMSADELQEARGGFSVGGLQFNIGVTVTPPTIAPIPDVNPIPDEGLFGPGGVHGPGGVFGSDDAPTEVDTVSVEAPTLDLPAPTNVEITPPVETGDPVVAPIDAAVTVDIPPATTDVVDIALAPDVAPATSAPVDTPVVDVSGVGATLPSSSPTGGVIGAPSASSPTPADTSTVSGNVAPSSAPAPTSAPSVAPQASPSASTPTGSAPTAAPAPAATPVTAPAPTVSTTTTVTPVSAPTAPAASPSAPATNADVSIDFTPNGLSLADGGIAQSTLQGGAEVSSSSGGGQVASGGSLSGPSLSSETDMSPEQAIANENASRGTLFSTLTMPESNADARGEDGLSMGAKLSELSRPEVVQEIGPGGVLTVINNALDNQVIRSELTMSIEVTNFANQMRLTQASNLTNRSFRQNIFLGGLFR